MKAKHKKKSSSRRKDPYVGKKVHALPLDRGPLNWLKMNAGKGIEYTVVTLVKREGEYLTMKAANGKVREFGPHDMTWMAITSVEEETGRIMKFTANCIADWIEDRDPLLAIAIRQEKWKGNPPQSSKFLTIEPS